MTLTKTRTLTKKTRNCFISLIEFKNIFREKADLYKHIENCQEMYIAYDCL